MKRSAATGLVALLLGVVVAALVPTADAAEGFSLTVDHRTLRSGEVLRVTAHADVSCTWALNWDGEKKIGHAKVFSTSFTAPTVAKATRLTLSAKCFYYPSDGATPAEPAAVETSSGSTDSETIVVTVPPSWTGSTGITVLPAETQVGPPTTHPDGGGLPGTGGPSLWALLAGAAAAVVGVLLVAASRRRRPVAVEA